ncbi:MAG: hypothetical protein EXR31_03725 [Betaproteobacteria bacterium]|nr:hypothetical protein [Betaproteobacteria bacterium]
MAFEKIADNEVASPDGLRIKLDQLALIYAQGTRYLTIPVEQVAGTGELRVRLTKMGAWMENGLPCESEGTLNMQRMKARVAEALTVLGRKFTIDV